MCQGNVLSELLLLLQVILLPSVSVTAFLEGSGVSSLLCLYLHGINTVSCSDTVTSFCLISIVHVHIP